jgi:hypothetical protein
MNLRDQDFALERAVLAVLRSRARRIAAMVLLFLLSICCESAVAADPIAACKLQTITNQSNDMMVYSATGVLAQPQADGSLGYRRGAANDWLVPDKVDPKDAAILGFLMTPAGPLLVKIEVQIDGRPFRSLSEQWIDTAFEQGKSKPATAESSADTKPVSVPVDKSAESSPKSDAVAGTMVSAQKFQAASPVEWLTEYVRNAGGSIDRSEARWLLAQRAGGPALMELERFSTSRSTAAPLVQFIDLDSDGVLSAAEIQQIDGRLTSSDFNQDGSVDLAELERSRPRKGSAYRVWRAEPLFVVVNTQTDWQALERSVKSLYSGMNGSGKDLDAASLERQASGEPAFVVRVHLGRNDSKAGVELVGLSAVQDVSKSVRTSAEAIAIDLGHSDVEIAAGQEGESMANGQVSVGAATEGLPLWSLVDTDNDGRLSVRERSSITDQLATLDQNHDGTLISNEIPTRIRLGVAFGPTVHQLLTRRTPPIPRQAVTPRAEAPDWFASMDANKDGDLSIGEFFGTPEQFKILDKNSDGLVSLKEAAQAEPPK